MESQPSMLSTSTIGEVATRLRVLSLAREGDEATARQLEVAVQATLPRGFLPIKDVSFLSFLSAKTMRGGSGRTRSWLGDDLKLNVVVRNVGTQPVRKLMIVLGPSKYFAKTMVAVPDLVPICYGAGQHVAEVQVELLATGTPSVADLDASVPFKLCTSDPSAPVPYCAQSRLQLGIEMFAGDALGWRRVVDTDDGPLGANILLFGPFGCGKSSCVNLLVSALSPRRQQLGQEGGSDGHITDMLRRWPLGSLCSEAIKAKVAEQDVHLQGGDEEDDLWGTWPVTVWDTWGTDKNNYTDEEFESLLRGYLRSGTTMKDILGQAVEEGRLRRLPTAICLFIPQAAVLADDEEVAQLARFCKIATRLGRAPLVLISRADEEPNPAQREMMLAKMAAAAFISRDRILFLENYTEPGDAKNFDKERVALRILLHSLKATDAFFERERNHPTEIKGILSKSVSQRSTVVLRKAESDEEAKEIPLPSTFERFRELVAATIGFKLTEQRFWTEHWAPLSTWEAIKDEAKEKRPILCGNVRIEVLRNLKHRPSPSPSPSPAPTATPSASQISNFLQDSASKK